MIDQNQDLELYIHIPFCIRKCNYCDFLSFPSDGKTRESYVQTLCDEIRQAGSWLADGHPERRVSSIFFGGGTPSILKGDQVRRIMEEVREHFLLKEDAEISIEANPGTMDREKLLAWKTAGINRLSMGLQTTDDRLLSELGRIHSFEEFLANYRESREAGFANINVALMSGLPGQSVRDYEDSLRKICGMKPEHISSYSLILEEGTPFYESPGIRERLPDEELERELYEMTGRVLSEYGYEQYEISNYALPGRECRHNIGYWTGVPYLGLGLGASSYLNGARFVNESDLGAWLEHPFLVPDERESYELLTRQDLLEEFLFLGLRMRRGVSYKEFSRRFGCEMKEMFGPVISTYIKSGHLEENDGFLRLTKAGINVCDYIIVDLIGAIDK